MPTSDTDDLQADLESLRIERTGRAPVGQGRTRRRLVLALLVLAGLIVVGLVRATRPVEVSVARVEAAARGAEAVLAGSGYVVTGERYVSIGVRVAGRIDRYFVEEGQRVTSGDPLVQLDDRDYRATEQRAVAALAVARANVDLARAELGRGAALHRDGVVSQQELDVLRNKGAVARATLVQQEAVLSQARVNLEYTLLRAPTDGIVLAKLKEVGEIAVPGGFAGSGDLIRLANMTDLRAEVDVNEADLRRVRMGQAAEVTPDAYPDARYAAVVAKLYPQVDRQKGTLKIEVRVLEPDERLLPDMSVRIRFLSSPTSGDEPQGEAVVVPMAAVSVDEDGRNFVWEIRDGRAYRVDVETGGSAGDRVRVRGDLVAGAAVVLDPMPTRERQRVTVSSAADA